MKKIFYLSIAATCYACGAGTAVDTSQLPGTYIRYKDLGTAHVWDTIVIEKVDPSSARFNVVQRITKERSVDGNWLPKENSEEKMDGKWNERTGEIYLEQQGKTYSLDMKNSLLTDQVDTFHKITPLVR